MIEKIIATLESRRDSYRRLQAGARKDNLLQLEVMWESYVKVMDRAIDDIREILAPSQSAPKPARRYLPSRHPAAKN